MRLPLLLLSLLGLLAAGCDTECVGPNCADDDDSSDDDDAADDDDASADDDDATEPPVIVESRSCEAELRYAPVGNAFTVEFAGEFNNWQPTPMEEGDDGVWTGSAGELAAGEYAYKFIVNGQWEDGPPPWDYAKWLDGVENRNLRHGDCGKPLLQTVSASGGADGVRVEILVARSAGGADLDAGSVVVTVGGVEVDADIDGQTISVDESGLAPGKHSVRVWAADEDGNRAENEPLFVPLWVEDQPWRWTDGLMYFAFTDRFRNSDAGSEPWGPIDGIDWKANYQGGDFGGVTAAIEEGYFDALGVDVIWLSPVYENAEGPFLATDGFHQFSAFHGYWPTSHRAIETRFGDAGADGEQRLRELIDAAHARGIRVMFDTVLNHVHDQHEYLGSHPEWFGGGCVCGTDGCGWDDRALDCWFTDYLPDLNYRNHWIVRQMVEDTLWLVEEFDADGLRVDAAKHMDHVIMRTMRRRLEQDFESGGGATVHTVGETFTGGDGHGLIMQYVSDDELHAQFDFPIYWAIRAAFAGNGSFNALDAAVRQGEAAYGDAVMSPFLGNHDIPRFSTEAAGNDEGGWGNSYDQLAANDASWLVDRMALAFAFTLTQPGLPLLYYGDEIGLAGGGDPDNRRAMTFEPFLSDQQRALLSRVQAVGQARRASEAIRRGDRSTLWVEDDFYVYAYATADDGAVVVINRGGDRNQSMATSIPLDGVTLTDALGSGRTATVAGGQIAIDVGANQALILLP